MTLSVRDLVAQARSRISEVDPGAFVEAAPGDVLIDVREPAEYAAGHLPGAINIPRGVLEFEIEAHPALGGVTDPALADRTRPITLYCRSGGRAALAAQSLQQLGFTRVRSLAGGIMAWTAAGLPVIAR
ncbi:rhodanese-like domain-containing protein [Vulcaniibacterium gelatinicum]|uniref:rhodanese-like domain-containing protein n=1 Tax=Vulcaniibacterium gelatinicum TaxID=2598725 RepID=UPI0011C7ED6D|nr:rhodanese-like domain-containing protein [Vulcaniibacterium gelatinicum]